MLGGTGLADASKLALLNANYVAERLKDDYTIRFVNGKGRVAHECLIDLAEFDKRAGVKVTDFAKRLQVSILSFFLLVLPAYHFLGGTGLRVPSSDMFMAHLDGNAHRTDRI